MCGELHQRTSPISITIPDHYTRSNAWSDRPGSRRHPNGTAATKPDHDARGHGEDSSAGIFHND